MLFLSSLLVQVACTHSKDTGTGILPPGEEPNITLPAPHLRRLNSEQYNNVVEERTKGDDTLSKYLVIMITTVTMQFVDLLAYLIFDYLFYVSLY